MRAGLCHDLGEEFKHNKPAEFDVFRLVNHAHPVATEVLDHDKDFENLAKMYVSAYETVPNVHWATFQLMYGQQSGTAYAVFSPLKSASEVDQELVMGKQFEQSMGEEGMKKLSDLSAASMESAQTNLFIFNPRESYVSDKWVAADPFWRVAAKPAKPSQ